MDKALRRVDYLPPRIQHGLMVRERYSVDHDLDHCPLHFNSDEASLRDVLEQENFIPISEKITPKALTKCKKNCLFMSMEVSSSI